MVDLVVLSLVSMIYLMLASLVMLSDAKAKLNRILAGLLIVTPLWSLVVFLEDVLSDNAAIELLVRLDYTLAALLVGIFYWFCEELVGGYRKIVDRTVLVLVTITASLSATGLMVAIDKTSGQLQLHPRPISFAIFVLLLGIGCGMSVWMVVRGYYRARDIQRTQIGLVGAGLFMTVVILIFALIVAPRLLSLSEAYVTRMGLYGTLGFAVMSAYAILRHGFLDIKRAVTRTTTYFFILVSLTIVYVGVGFGIASLLFGVEDIDARQLALFTIVAISLAFLYQPIKQFFDVVTDKIFYRRAYTVQSVLADMGDITSKNVDVSRIMHGAVTLLHATFKPTYVSTYVVRDKSLQDYYDVQIGHQKPLDGKALSKFHKIKQDITTRMYESDAETRELLAVAEAEVLVRLTTSHQTLGYLLLGEKQTGESFDKNDIHLLSTIGNELALAIQNGLRFQEIRDLNESLQHRIEQATLELRTSNSKLKKLDASKDEFISMASHQLRTPLTSIKGYISMLLDGDLGDLQPGQRKALEEAYNSSQRMVYLIGDFLNLSRLQTGKFVLEPSDVLLPRIIEEEISQLRASAETRGVTLVYESPTSFPIVRVDENKIRQVMMNFIDNAIYYAKPTDGRIEVSLVDHPHHVTFRVKDNGIGVAASDRPHLFTKFFRGGNARKARPDGTGIGLYMAKKVIIAHGGSIIFESREGEGSTFGFRLPTKSSS